MSWPVGTSRRIEEAVRFVSDRPSFCVDLVWPTPVVAVVALTGEVDLDTAPRFMQALFRAADEGARQVVVDLSLVPFIDTAGIAALIAGARRLGAQKASLVVVCPVAGVRRTLSTSGLADTLGICATRAEALADFYGEIA
jgi:anti-anti-sigma factor